jgi:hypothetical protein
MEQFLKVSQEEGHQCQQENIDQRRNREETHRFRGKAQEEESAHPSNRHRE